ncbi:MAG: DUF3592 domain-containing protein [Candidatus Sulfotelmatobacter sp.]
MTTQTPPKGGLLWAILIVLVFFSGLCTIFVSLVTTAQAWQEHAQSRWPEVTARVDRCDLAQWSGGTRESYYILCRLSYAVGAEQNVTTLHSGHLSPKHDGPLAEWIDEHPPGTSIAVRYDPTHPTKVVPLETGMLIGGPHTANNMKLLEVVAGTFLVLLTIMRLTRPRFVEQSGYSSMPYNP